jgi:hypothetical protein
MNQNVLRLPDDYRRRNGPEHTMIMFPDSAPTRRNLEALTIFRQHNIIVSSSSQHPMLVLLPWGSCPFTGHGVQGS